MKKNIFIILIMTVLVLSLSGCNSGGVGKVSGTFENVDGEVLMFAPDGSMRTIKGSDIAVGTFSTKGDDIELTYRGIAQKYGYSLKGTQLILYSLGTTNEVSTGIVYDKTQDSEASVARSDAAIADITGIYEDRAVEMTGEIINKAYIFMTNGTYRYLKDGVSTNGTYTVDGCKVILKATDVTEVWYGEIRNGDLCLFSAASAHSDGTYYTNVSSRYETIEAQYQEALEYNKTEQYEEAMNAFFSIKEYWDSLTLGTEAGYKAACRYYEKSEYRKALTILNRLIDLGGFDDYNSIYDECRKEVAREDVGLISFTAKEKRNSMEKSSYGGRVFEFVVEIANASPDDIIELQGMMNIYNGSNTQLMTISLYNGDGIKSGMTRTLRFSVDANASAGTEELYNTVLERLNISFVLDTVTLDGTTYTNVNVESKMAQSAEVLTMDSSVSNGAEAPKEPAASNTEVSAQGADVKKTAASSDSSSIDYSGFYSDGDEAGCMTVSVYRHANDDAYDVEIGIIRLGGFDGTGYVKNDVLVFEGTDPSGSKIAGELAPSGDAYQFKFTNAYWYDGAVKTGDSYLLYKGGISSAHEDSIYDSAAYVWVIKCNESITLRAEPNTKAADLAQIPKYSRVTYLGQENSDFSKIEYNGKTGYSLSSYLDFFEPQVYTGLTYRVTNCKDYITLRSIPKTTGQEIAKIPLGATVDFIENHGEFYLINYNGQVGYALASYLY